MKRCSKCGEEKELSEFNKDKSKKSGLRSICQVCHRKQTRKWQDENREKFRKTARDWHRRNRVQSRRNAEKWRRENPERLKELQEKWRKANPNYQKDYQKKEGNQEKKKARNALRYAVRTGKLIRPSQCEKCGATGKIQGHHWSYEKQHWLDVQWLCITCHGLEHRKDAVDSMQ